MDIRIEKTKQSIINAFIEIRSRKEVERITVKELCEKARINKSTFYAHYKDIYDLSDQLETELVDSIMENFNHPENLLQNPADFTKEIFMGYMAKDTLIRTLFSGSRSKFLVQKMESALKALVSVISLVILFHYTYPIFHNHAPPGPRRSGAECANFLFC